MSRTVADHILAPLAAAGPDGLTAQQIATAVTVSRGKPTLQETVSASISAYRTTHPTGPQLQLKIVSRVRRWTLVPATAETDVPARLADCRPDDRSIRPHSLTAALLGDPLPGRSAFDHRELEKGRLHA